MSELPFPQTSKPDSPTDISANFDTNIEAKEIDSALRSLGYEAFRGGQREAIETLFDDRKLLLVAPTGGGKSLTYQLPALLLPGTTVVISPLISLMQDQVSALQERDVAATFLASTLSPDELAERIQGISQGRYRLVYVAPERLSFPGFRALLTKLDCPLVAIDEAHCISEWGHDFRPEYMQIGDVLSELPKARVLACTATATPVVRDEILDRLGLPADTPQLVHGFARPNLALRVRETNGKKERNRWVEDALAECLGQPGGGRGAVIIYSPTRRMTEDEFMRLDSLGWQAAPYHAGLDPKMRESVHRRFSSGEVEVVVATNAFGMGIDRADVRGVIHLAPPGSVESYYQEVGRAGRDGEDAIGLMFLSAGDMPRRRHLIESDNAGLAPDSDIVRHKWNLFLELMRFAEGGSCRHDAILRYFGDEAETLSGCGRCDVCLRISQGSETEFSDEDAALIVRKSLAGVARIHGRFGLGAAVALLRGVKDDRLERMNLHITTTFGILEDFSEDWLTRLLRRCVTAGWVDFWGGDRPVVILTEEGMMVMKGDRPVRLLLPPQRRPGAPARRGSRRSGSTSAPAAENLSEEELALFDALRAHRLEVARQAGVPPYVVASDRTLRETAALRPLTHDELLQVHGIGPKNIEKYGDGLLAVVSSFLQDAGAS